MFKKSLSSCLAAIFVFFSAAVFAAEPEDVLVIEVEGSNPGTIEIELFPELAPNHVARIKVLARDGVYNDVAFHRVIDGFMAQTGDVKHGRVEGYLPRYAGQGGSNYPDIAAEFSDYAYAEGVVGMARSSSPDSANSQFFIMNNQPDADRAARVSEALTGAYTVFGRVISGQDVVNGIKLGQPDLNGAVLEAPDYMAKVYIKSDAPDG
ncbi:MAG: peptidylprolyl isomerase [Pseudomonadota bacterium]